MKNNPKKAALLGLFLAGIARLDAQAAVHYVDLNSPNSSPPFGSWATAARVIQDAVDSAMAGDEILVTNGAYTTGGRAVYGTMTNRVTMDKAVTLRSVNGPLVTLIQGHRVPVTTNGYAAIRCAYLTDGASISGFTLTNGATRLLNDAQTNIDLCGGGVWCESTAAVVSNCVLVGNSAYIGGGAYGGTVNNCTLRGNSAASDWDGGGGGAAHSLLNNCILSGNAAGAGGGASGSTLNNCMLSDNLALWGGGAFGGQDNDLPCTLNNCTLTRNSAQYGGGIYSYCDLCSANVYSTLNNSILYFNTAPAGDNYYGGVLNYCCTTPLPSSSVLGTGNISADPQLASASHLSAASPCRGSGSADYAAGSDIDGEAWASSPSIGCDEYHLGAVTGPLSASITAAFTNVAVGFMLSFTAQIIGQTTASVWDFGQGVTLTNQPYTSHAWAVPGDYAVVLRAYNEDQPGGISATVAVHVATQPVHYVAAGSTNPVAPYLSWATAATKIQDAVDSFEAETVPGALVLVSNGTYAFGGRAVYGTRTYTFPNSVHGLMTNRVVLDRPVILRSLNGPQFTVIRGYQVPGTTNGDSAIRCAYLSGGANLSGFTLTQGATAAEQSGGGLWCDAPTAVISNCLLVSNSSALGGGAYHGTLNNCTIAGNSASDDGGGAAWGRLNNCTLSGNNSAGNGGGSVGGILNNCTLRDNSASGYGGGSYDGMLSNCTLRRNSSAFLGGGACYGTLNNCTIVSNLAGWAGGAYEGTLDNCIVYFNADPFLGNYDGPGDQGNLNYSCTTPQPVSGFGNITNVPLFVDVAGGDLRLQSNSPCINAGNNARAPAGLDLDGNPRLVGGTVDMGAYEFQNPSSLISYAWLQQYGLPTDGSADDADSDADGMNNWQEWVCGTNPTNGLSVLKILTPASNGSNVVISWQSVAGVNYSIERSSNVSGTFKPLTIGIVGQTPTTTFNDTTAVSGGSFLYRVSVGHP